MSYQAGRNKSNCEILELVNTSGNVVETITVRLDADGMAEKVSQEYVNLVRVESQLRDFKHSDATPDLMEEVGNAVICLYRAVFGQADTDRILNFYEGNYIEMCQNVNPFIINICLPKIRKIAQKKRKVRLNGYNRKRKQHMQKFSYDYTGGIHIV